MTRALTLREIESDETQLAYPVLRVPRPEFGDEHSFVEAIHDPQRPDGDRLVGVFEDKPDHAVAAAGFRSGHSVA